MDLNRVIDITAEQRTTVLGLLRKHLPNTTAWAYGSRIQWNANRASDLDLVVFSTPDQDLDVSDLREAFEESDLPFRVDLFVWRLIPREFRERIESDHVELTRPHNRATRWTERVAGDLGRVVDVTGPTGRKR